MADQCQERSDSDCPWCPMPPGHIGKARDIFSSAENVMPLIFTGARLHFTFMTGGPWDRWTDASMSRWWSATSLLKMNASSFYPGPLRVSFGCNGRWPVGCTSAFVELDPKSGNWNFESFGRTAEDRVHGAATAQVSAWNRLATLRFDVDYMVPGMTMSLSVDPKLKECSLHYIQAISEQFSLGGELTSKKSCVSGRYPEAILMTLHPAILAKYTGPNYVVSGKMNPLMRTIKAAYYHHWQDWLHVGAILEMGACRPFGVARLGFRVLSDSSVFRAAVGTDGVFSSLWEKRIVDRVSLAMSLFMNHKYNEFGMGIGLSIE